MTRVFFVDNGVRTRCVPFAEAFVCSLVVDKGERVDNIDVNSNRDIYIYLFCLFPFSCLLRKVTMARRIYTIVLQAFFAGMVDLFVLTIRLLVSLNSE